MLVPSKQPENISGSHLDSQHEEGMTEQTTVFPACTHRLHGAGRAMKQQHAEIFANYNLSLWEGNNKAIFTLINPQVSKKGLTCL